MAELLITSSLDPINERDVFTKEAGLPRHVTVWQYFDLPDIRENEFIADIGNAVEAFAPFEIEGEKEDMFGPNNDVPVRRVRMIGKGATLITLHTVFGVVIQEHEAFIRNPEWAYENYNPHITYKDGRALEEGERATLGTVELIKLDPISKSKFVRKVWGLEEV